MPRAHLRRCFTLPASAATGLAARGACGGHGARTALMKTTSTHPAADTSTAAADAQALATSRAAFADWTAGGAPASKTRRCGNRGGDNGRSARRSHCTEATYGARFSTGHAGAAPSPGQHTDR